MTPLQLLPSLLLLLTLRISEWPATDPLIRTRLPTDSSLLRSKHQTPSSKHRQRSIPGQTKGKALLKRVNILRVAIECAERMKDGGKEEGRVRIGGLRIGVWVLC